MLPLGVPYKFPRLWKRYEVLISVGDTEGRAKDRVEQKLLDKSVYRCLDKVVCVYPASAGFEAALHFLHPKFECELSELEKQYMNGVLSKLTVIDTDPVSLEKIVDAAVGLGRYEARFCDNPRGAVEFVRDNFCDVLVMRHNMDGNNGFQVVQRLHKMSILPKTVIYGNIPRKTIDYYYATKFAWYAVKQHDSGLILSAVEKVLNNIRAVSFTDFILP